MNKEKWSSLVWFCTGLLICIGSVKLSLGSPRNPGPGFLPFIAGTILTILALIVHIQSRLASSPAQKTIPLWADRGKGFKMVWTVIALLGYAVGLEYLGFLLSTTMFIGFLLWAIEPRPWSMIILGSVLTAVITYCIFELWLQTRLPQGFFSIF